MCYGETVGKGWGHSGLADQQLVSPGSSRVQQGGDVSQAVLGRAARREHAWPSGRLGRGGATIAHPPRRDALVLNEDDHLLPEGCGLLDRGGVHPAPLQVEGDCPPPPPPLNFILCLTLPQPYLAASVRRL